MSRPGTSVESTHPVNGVYRGSRAIVADWIEEFLAYSDGQPSPAIFREWAAIATLGAAAERRLYVEVSQRQLYPNLYVLLVGPPGSGKTVAIDLTRDLLRNARPGGKRFHLAPSSVTSAALLDSIQDASRLLMTEEGPIEYRSLIAQSSEFGVLVPSHDLEFMAQLNDIFDNPQVFSQRRRHQNAGKTNEILLPQLNILAGAQPGFLNSLLPEEAWSMGFTSRLIMIYAPSAPVVELFADNRASFSHMQGLSAGLTTVGKMIGRLGWHRDAAEYISEWHRTGCKPVPESPRLQHYISRRSLMTIKLSMIAAISREALEHAGDEANGVAVPNISLADVQRAQNWLLHAEQLMPDIFREMNGKSDYQVLEELHFFLWGIWAKKPKPIPLSTITYYLAARVPHEKVLRLIDIAEKSNMLVREAGTQNYIPRPKAEHGMEHLK